MKTGKLVKFRRCAGLIHAYFYQDGGLWRAALYLMAPGRDQSQPVLTVSAPSEAEVDRRVRAWIDERFPQAGGPR